MLRRRLRVFSVSAEVKELGCNTTPVHALHSEGQDGVGASRKLKACPVVGCCGFVEGLGRNVLRRVETVVSFQVAAGERERFDHPGWRGIFPEQFHFARVREIAVKKKNADRKSVV